MAEYISLSDKIGQYSNYVLTPTRELVLFYPTDKLFDIKDVKPAWFRCKFPGGYVGMRTYLQLQDAEAVGARCIMVLTLDLKGLCRLPGITVMEYTDALVFSKGRMFASFEQKNGITGAECTMFDYDVMSLIKHKETFYSYKGSPDKKTKLWRELLSNCYVTL